MTFTVTLSYNSFMDYIKDTDLKFKDKYLNLPEKGQKALNDWFDDNEVAGLDAGDEIWKHHVESYTTKELLVDDLDYLTVDELNKLKEQDKLEEFINKHKDDMLELFDNEGTPLLDVDIKKDEWIFFSLRKDNKNYGSNSYL